MLIKIKNNKTLIYMILPLIIMISIITTKVITQKELFIDKLAHNILIEQLRSPSLTVFMKTITKLSNTNFIIIFSFILTLLCLFIWKKEKLAKLIPLNLVAVTSINIILKLIFQRERPIGYRLIEITGYSFPSGHAMISMGFYGLLIYLIFHYIKNKTLRNSLIIINILIIILIGISRVYLGVHYLSDVLTGYSVSIIYLFILTKYLKKLKFIP